MSIAYRCLVFAVAFASVAVSVSGDNIDSLLGPAPGTYRILSDDGTIRVSFELFRGDIRFACEVNGRPVKMLIDNGFLWDPLLFFGSPTVDSLGLEYDGEAEVSGGGDGDAVQSKTASGITVSFPDVEFYEQTAIITPYSSGHSRIWWGAEGQLSATFLKHFVVEFDFDEMVMTLIRPDEFVYRGGGAELSIKHLMNNSWAIPATVKFADGKAMQLDLAMDLGLGDALHFVAGGPVGIRIPEEAVEASLGYGVQGEIRGAFARVRRVTIGDYEFDDVLAGFVAEDYQGSTFHEATIGMELLSRFNFIYDYPHGRMYIEPNETFGESFEYNMTGLSMRPGQGEYLEIVRVLPNSPAEEVGLGAGDRVLQINGRAAVDYDVWELRPMFRRAGETVRLVVLRKGAEAEEEMKLTLRRLL